MYYIELLRDEYWKAYVDKIYQITYKEEDWINTTMEGKLSWEEDSSCTSDSEEELENLQNMLCEIPTRRCVRIKK